MTAQPVYGNYHDYYSKRPYTSREPRLSLLPTGLFKGKRVLDVGCNQGWVTCEIAQLYGASKVVGVDIDATLISQAWKRRRYVWSLQQPETSDSLQECISDGKRPRKRRKQSSTPSAYTLDDTPHPHYFPSALQHMFGPLPLPDLSTSGSTTCFPLNVTFRSANWVEDGVPEDVDGWDVVIAFSVTKWIHLNQGDDGLRAFFQRIHKVLNPGGTLVLEPQEWSSYSKAWRMDTRLKETAKGLVLRPEDFEAVLVDIGFTTAQHLGSTGQTGFDRPIDLYVKIT